MYNININEELTADKISRIIQSFEISEKIKLQRYYDYFRGKQAILNKSYKDASKPCNHIVKNYCFSIVNNYQGYIAGIPITYNSNDDITNLIDIFNYNDIKNADAALLKNALIFGVAYEICYIDEDTKQRFKVIDSRECIPVYDDTLNENLLYMIRYYKKPSWKEDAETRYIIEVYSNASIRRYESNFNFSSLSLLEENPHYFKQVPFVEFRLNEEKDSIFDKIISLQDAYNELLSSEVDDFQAFTDAYLVLKGCGIAEEDAAQMRENRILMLDSEDSAEYLTKNISDTQIENMLSNINDSIHVIANSPDFNDEKFMATSGIAMRYKLVGFENTSSAIAANMTKALQRRIELLYTVMGLIAGDKFKDVQIKFTRNLPLDNTEIINTINSLRGMLSDRTLISLLPFVSDVDAELEAIQTQKVLNMEMYNFGGTAEETKENE